MAQDTLRALRGKAYEINDKIRITIPTLGEIEEYGEQRYFSLIANLTVVPNDLISELDKIGIDWETIDEFNLFTNMCSSFRLEDTSIVMGDLDLSSLKVFKNNQNEQLYLSEISTFHQELNRLDIDDVNILIDDVFSTLEKDQINALKEFAVEYKNTKDKYNLIGSNGMRLLDLIIPKYNGIKIDRLLHYTINRYLRKVHGYEIDDNVLRRKTGGTQTKRARIQLDRDDKRAAKRKKFKSNLENYIITLVNCQEFKYDYDTVWDLHLNVFLASLRQIMKNKGTYFNHVGIFTGNIDSKKMKNKSKALNWFYED